METKKKLSGSEKVAYGLGAVGKDMVYMLSASYISIYFLDIMGISAVAIGILLMVARVFDAFNDPIMGVLVAKTKTKWGKFRPWLFIGTVTNAIILYMMFSVPPTLDGAGLVAYASVTYILWGVTYTMMDIPYWSMIPAFTESGKEREGLSAFARSCAGVGSALISIVTVMSVSALGTLLGGATENEKNRLGYSAFALIIGIIFIVFVTITCAVIKEKSTVDMKSASIKDMFRALVQNDQAMTVVIAIVMINTALYITQQLVYFFLKYDFSPLTYKGDFTLFNTVGGGCQILAMMLLFPILRKFMDTVKIFYTCFGMAVVGYVLIIIISMTGTSNVFWLLIPAALIMAAVGVLNVIITVFLANTVDYGELKNNRRDESVIFSMQTFVVKLASGISGFLSSMVLFIFNINSDKDAEEVASDVISGITTSQRMGLRLSMTLIPIAVLLVGGLVFKKHYILTDEKMNEITTEIEARH
ncbi:MFS transporter [Pseudobutyrivibrio sp.]|uniref:MFS transporter n=1 Tax=Pseudobutyrivibrio sp. TaxID=2014367 RepID=UPI001B4A2BC6|nr:glycoside-pentoside-hexuronide (GPH):cation symporter [Pseudobutyrivibrio sp.]MBP3261925.1 MFS transporter [Pseudobutyrivibrio sp.]